MKMTKEFVLEEIKRIYSIHGKVTKDNLRSSAVSYDTVKRRFGSMHKALSEAGIEAAQGQRRYISKEEIIVDLKRVYKLHGRMSKPLYEQAGKHTPKVVQRIFGSFSNMMKELCFEQHPSGYVATDEELIQDLVKLHQKHGLVTANTIKMFSAYSTTTYHERFGSLNKAYVAAGLDRREPGQSSHADWVIKRFGKIIGEEPIFEQRFDWLRHDVTNRQLPIDGYFPKANIAIEYNGPQHYKIDAMYTKTQEALDYRQYLDKIKYELIEKHGVKLIVVHYMDTFNDDYIYEKLM